MTSRYPTPAFRRTALAPGILAAIVILAGLALLDADGYIVIRYVVSILAIIVAIFAGHAKQWWWIAGLVPIAVLWNPVLPIPLHGQWWVGLQYIAALVFILSGWFIRVPNEDDRNRRTR